MQTVSSSYYSVVSLPWQRPVLLAEKIKSLGYMVWFDSTSDIQYADEEEKRYDIFTACPEMLIFAKKSYLNIVYPESGESKKIIRDPFEYIEECLQQPCNPPDAFPFCGGIAGYWGYELNHITEPASVPERKNNCADMGVGLYLWSLVADNKNKQLSLIFHPNLIEEKRKRIAEIISYTVSAAHNCLQLKTRFIPQITYREYEHAFSKIKQYILAGDCYQVNLAQQFSAEYTGDLFLAYQHLRKVSPTPFSSYMDMGPLQILSHSPERFLKTDRSKVQSMPIKGTCKRLRCRIKDRDSAEKLLSSEKNRAENLMSVDLLRNDLNRNCEPNSVKVPEPFKLKSYANVHHLVSTIEGCMKTDITPVKLLKNAFPGGSITGAPKIRAMQIIRELEPAARSVYCGAIGYISFNKKMDTNIPIRTLTGNNKKLSCWGGGAIVADSDCQQEYEESVIKIANLTSCLENRYFYQSANKASKYVY